jgi:hypothetical protein
MSSDKFCPSCGAEVEEGNSFCQKCGASLAEASGTPAANQYREPFRGGGKSASEHLKTGYAVAVEQPMVFLPVVISGLIGALADYSYGRGGDLWLLMGLAIGIVQFILSFASTDMSRDAYYSQPLNLGESINYVISRIIVFFLASIVAGLLSITIILIPLAIFMTVIMVMDETGITDALSKAFNVIRADLKDVLLIILVSIVASIIISYVPLGSTLLSAALNVIVGLAFIDVYATYKHN